MNEKASDLLIRRMSQCYEEQMTAYKEMYSLALEQGQCIQAAEADTAQLFALVSRRQVLIKRLEDMQAVIRGLEEEVKSLLGIPEFTVSKISAECNTAEVPRLSLALGNFTALIASIKNLDKINEDRLRLRIKETANNLVSIQKEKKARKAYQQKATNKGGIFVDFAK